jgi:hypothetical protein
MAAHNLPNRLQWRLSASRHVQRKTVAVRATLTTIASNGEREGRTDTMLSEAAIDRGEGKERAVQKDENVEREGDWECAKGSVSGSEDKSINWLVKGVAAGSFE